MATDPAQQAPARKTRICGAEARDPLNGQLMKCRVPLCNSECHSPTDIHRDGTFYWDDHEIKTSWPSGTPDTCALCGQHEPSHVAVRDGDDMVADRICARHSLYEVIRSGKFFVQVSVVHE